MAYKKQYKQRSVIRNREELKKFLRRKSQNEIYFENDFRIRRNEAAKL